MWENSLTVDLTIRNAKEGSCILGLRKMTPDGNLGLEGKNNNILLCSKLHMCIKCICQF